MASNAGEVVVDSQTKTEIGQDFPRLDTVACSSESEQRFYKVEAVSSQLKPRIGAPIRHMVAEVSSPRKQFADLGVLGREYEVALSSVRPPAANSLPSKLGGTMVKIKCRDGTAPCEHAGLQFDYVEVFGELGAAALPIP